MANQTKIAALETLSSTQLDFSNPESEFFDSDQYQFDIDDTFSNSIRSIGSSTFPFTKDTQTRETDHFKYKFNVSSGNVQSAPDDLRKVLSGSITRNKEKVSSSQDSYSHRFGTSTSINIGNSYSYTQLESGDTKSSIKGGKTVSISIGDSSSETHSKDNLSIKHKGNTFSIKTLTGMNYSHNTYGAHMGFTTLLSKFSSVESPIGCDTEFGIFRFDYTLIPLKGHFTAFQQICSAVYGDFVDFENLARVVGLSYTWWDAQEVTDRKELKVLEQPGYMNASFGLTLAREDDAVVSTTSGVTTTGATATISSDTVGLQSSTTISI